MKSEQNRRRSMACTVESIGQGADDYPGFRFSSPIRLHPAWRNSALHPVRRLWLAPIRPDGPLRSDDSFRVAAFGPSFQRWVCSDRQNPAPAPGDNDEKVQPTVLGILLGSTSNSVLSRSPNAGSMARLNAKLRPPSCSPIWARTRSPSATGKPPKMRLPLDPDRNTGL